MSEIKFIYPGYWVAICIVAALLITLIIYYRDKKNNILEPWKHWILGVLRFSTVLIIALLLLSPLLKQTANIEIKPFLVIAQDNSTSINATVDSIKLRDYNTRLEALKNSLSSKYELSFYTFGEKVVSSDANRLDYNEKKSNISDVFEYVKNQFKSNTPGAIILSTDGIYNEGYNPIYAAEALSVPTFVIGMGDTTQRRDLAIRNVFHNNIAYLNDEVKIQVDITAVKSAGQNSQIRFGIVENGKVSNLDKKEINITGENFFHTVTFSVLAEKNQQLHLRLSLDPITNEASLSNNSRDIYIDVIDNRKKIRIFAHSPHPDLGAIKKALESQKGNEVSIDFDITRLQEAIKSADALILHQLPSREKPVTAELKSARENKKPVFFILGASSEISAFNNSQDLLQIQAGAYRSNDVEGIFKGTFNLFSVMDDLKLKIPSYPPVQTPFGSYTLANNANVLLYQQIKRIDTDYPLLLAGENLGWKTAIMTAENTWRWRLFNHLEDKNFDTYDDIISKTLQYLTIREDKRRFRTYLTNTRLDELSSIVFGGELYNSNYEPVNTSDVTLTVKNEDGEDFDYIFDRKNNLYQLNAGIMAPGSYTYLAKTNYNNEDFTSSGTFIVKKVEIEGTNLVADFQMLNTLATGTGGKFFTASGLDELEKSLLENNRLKPQLSEISNTKPIINLSWLGFLLLLLLTVEWVIRKYSGLY